MNLQGNIVLHMAQYAAPYEGSFIKSLKSLEKALVGESAEMVYILPVQVERQPWYESFRSEHTVHLINPEDETRIQNVLEKMRPMIIHCHFEGYDIAAVKVSERIDSYAPRIVWHLHDWFSYIKHPLRSFHKCYGFFKHYCLYASDISVIGACDEIVDFVCRFKKVSGRDFYKKQTILNGIDLQRIAQPTIDTKQHFPFTFLTFGGRNISKRIDLVVRAFLQIFENNPNAPYRLIITEGTDTKLVVGKLCMNKNGSLPSWCKVIPQQENVNEIFSQADCFISASDCETFSYVVCEASVYGLPVIQTNIPGTKWNNHNPSTFLFTPGSETELIEQMKHVAAMYPTLTQARKHTRENNKKYSLDKWSKQIIEYYRDL